MCLGNGLARFASMILKGKKRSCCLRWYLWALISSPSANVNMTLAIAKSNQKKNLRQSDRNEGGCKERAKTQRVCGKKLSGRQSVLPLATDRTHNRKWKCGKTWNRTTSTCVFFIINADRHEQHSPIAVSSVCWECSWRIVYILTVSSSAKHKRQKYFKNKTGTSERVELLAFNLSTN